MNEPLSMLQRFAESLEYGFLLDKGSQEKDPCLRIAYVAAYVFSILGSTVHRLKKPFNPLWGETFEYSNETFRFISE